MIWQILNIEETKDKRAITRAYRDRLTTTNPEEKPEEFKELRAAYEEAMRLADVEEVPPVPEEEKTPVERWTDHLAAVYGKMRSRCDVLAWEKLLSEDVCQSLDSRQEIEEAMLRFFLEHFRIPHAVMVFLNERFDFTGREEELKEIYPDNFVHYILVEGSREEEGIPYAMFDPEADGAAVDEYLSLYNEAVNTPFADSASIYEKMERMEVHHPYGDALKARYDYFSEDSSAISRLEAIAAAYPDDVHLLIDRGILYREAKQYNDAATICRRAMELEPDNNTPMHLLAYVLADQEKYQEAVETINNLMDRCEGNDAKMDELDRVRHIWNDILIKQFDESSPERQADSRLRFEAVWSCVQNRLNEKAEALFADLAVNEPEEFDYEKLAYAVTCVTEKNEESLRHLSRVIELSEGLSEDGTEKTARRIRKLPGLYLRKCSLLLELNQKAEAKETMLRAVSRYPDNAEVLTQAWSTAMRLHIYGEAGDFSRNLIRLFPDSYSGYLRYALTCFMQHRDNDAFTAVNTALELDGSDLTAYLLKLRILIRNEAFEPAEDLINFLRENGFSDYPVVRWCEAQILVTRDKDNPKAMEIYREVDAKLAETGEKIDGIGEFYFMMTALLADIKDEAEDYTREDLFETLEKGLKADPDSFDCLEYKAWLLMKENRTEESIEIYKRLEAEPRQNLYIEKKLAEAYFDLSTKYADKALAYYKMLEELEDDKPDYHQALGYLYFITDDPENSEKHYLRALEMVPDSAFTCYRLAILYQSQNRLTEALTYAKRCTEISKTKFHTPEYSYHWDVLIRVLRRLGRVKEAVKAVEDAVSAIPGFAQPERRIFEIYRHAGYFKEAEKLVKKWKKKSPPEAWAASEAILYLLTRRYKEAYGLLCKYSSVLPGGEAAEIDWCLGALNGDFTVHLRHRKNDMTRAREHKRESLRAEQYHLALGYWLCGEKENARAAAEACLIEYEKDKALFDVFEPILEGNAAVAYAVLGRFAEAEAAIERMSQVPFCASCEYGMCKDQVIYHAIVRMIVGDDAGALQLLRSLWEADPGELDLIFLESAIKSKRM